MNRKAFEAWLGEYAEAWRLQDPQRAAALFSHGALYYETPFDEPLSGRDGIVQYWQEGAADSQTDISVACEALGVSGSVGVAHWSARFTRVPSGVKVELDGVLAATFDDQGLCCVFREWWHRRESSPT